MNGERLYLTMGQLSEELVISYKDRCKARLWRWSVNWRTRKQLKDLRYEQLGDIGISRSDALGEARKPFWID